MKAIQRAPVVFGRPLNVEPHQNVTWVCSDWCGMIVTECSLFKGLQKPMGLEVFYKGVGSALVLVFSAWQGIDMPIVSRGLFS